MQFEKDYFADRKYSLKEDLVKRHVSEVIRCASRKLSLPLTNGYGRRALDVGCAYGFTSSVLCDLGYETLGVDISSWGMTQAKKVVASFLICDAQINLPFEEGTFDLVTCFDVLEHLPHPEKALEGMLNACKGVLICTTPNRKVEKYVRKVTGDYDETHINVKSPEEWKALIGSYECNLARVEPFYDLAFKFAGKLFFKSFNVPYYGLTIRIMVKK